MKSLQDKLSFRLVLVIRLHRAFAEARLATLNLHPGQELILLLLAEENGLSQTELAERLDVEPPTVTKMLQRMEPTGYVYRCKDEQDGRVSRVWLTEAGQAIVSSVLQIWGDLDGALRDGMTEVEQVLLRRMLDQMRDNLSRRCAHPDNRQR